jgi:hypothetical protein
MKKHRPPRGFIDISGYEGRYAIGRNGRVFSFPDKRRMHGAVLHNTMSSHGYKTVCLGDSQGKKTKMYIHRLLAQTFLKNPDPITHTQVNHKNGSKIDNRLRNLEWVTHADNVRHAFATGLNYTSEAKREKLRQKFLMRTEKMYLLAVLLTRKPVLQLSVDGRLIQKFDSLSDAGRALGIPVGNISKVLKKRRNLAGGFKWAYAEKEPNE